MFAIVERYISSVKVGLPMSLWKTLFA